MIPKPDPHEALYQRVREQGLGSWNALRGIPDMEPAVERFLADVLEQTWVPRTGAALELGCGTGPMSRWLHGRGWDVTGMDISPTAIALAEEQSSDLPIRFFQGNGAHMADVGDASMDLALDGQCLHCLVAEEDREGFFRNAARVLRPGGCLVLITMVRPLLRAEFRQTHGFLRNNRVYMPAPGAEDYAGLLLEGDRRWIPTRYLAHWREILGTLKASGFKPLLMRLNLCHEGDPLSYLACASRRC